MNKFPSFCYVFILLWWIPIRNALSLPSKVKIGGIFPKLKHDGTGEVDSAGVQYIAAFLMAIRDLNNKTDGLYDNILTNTAVEFALRESPGPFIDDIYSAIDLCAKVFNSTGVQGVVGAHNNDVSNAIAQIFNGFKMNQIAYGSTGSFLSYVGPYPYYFRTCSDDALQGIAMADIIYNHYKWTKVSTFSTSDTFGSDGIQQFNSRAAQLGINVISAHQFRHGLVDFTSIIESAKIQGTKIFVFFMVSSDASKLIEQGYNLGLFTTGTQIIGSGTILEASVWTAFSGNIPTQDLMKGILAVSQSYTYTTDMYTQFIQRWRAQNDTIHIGFNNVESCGSETDSDGGFHLYKGTTSTPYGIREVCTGLKFSSFAKDGSDIDNFVPFVYDATIAFAVGLHKLMYTEGMAYDGDAFGAVLAYNFSFTGVTGPISFRLGDPATGFGYGDRDKGINFDLLNFDPNLYCPSGKTGGIQTLGLWSVDTDYTAYSASISKAVYRTEDNSVPKDSPPSITSDITTSSQNILIALAVITLITIFAFSCVLYYYRKNKLLKASQPMMMVIVLVGALFSVSRVLSGSNPIDDSVCVSNVWFGHLAFAMVFGSLVMKTWRIHLIVNTGLKRVKVTPNMIMIAMGSLVSFFAVYLVVLTAVGDPHKEFIYRDLGKQQIMLLPYCVEKYSQFSSTLYCIEACMILQGARLCWWTKDVPDAVNDSKNVAMAMYAIMFISSVVFPIVYLLGLDPAVAALISGIGFAIGTLTALIVLFGPKTWLLWQGAILDSKLGIIMPGGKNKNLIGHSKVADKVENTEMPVMSTQVNMNFGKSYADQNSKLCREQIVRWQSLLLQVENGVGLPTSSQHSSHSQAQQSEGVTPTEDVMLMTNLHDEVEPLPDIEQRSKDYYS